MALGLTLSKVCRECRSIIGHLKNTTSFAVYPPCKYSSFSTTAYTRKYGDTDNFGASTKELSDYSVVLYRWPYVKHFRLLSRFKIYQLAVMTAALPYLAHLYKVGTVTSHTMGSGFVGTFGTAGVLLVISHYFMKVVGEITYDPENSVLRISVLTFWGNRQELYIPLEQIVQFNESQTNVGGTFQRLKVEGRKDNFFYSLRHGQIRDLKLLCEVLKIDQEDLMYFRKA